MRERVLAILCLVLVIVAFLRYPHWSQQECKIKLEAQRQTLSCKNSNRTQNECILFLTRPEIIYLLRGERVLFLGDSLTRGLVLSLLQLLDCEQRFPFSTITWFNSSMIKDNLRIYSMDWIFDGTGSVMFKHAAGAPEVSAHSPALPSWHSAANIHQKHIHLAYRMLTTASTAQKTLQKLRSLQQKDLPTTLYLSFGPWDALEMKRSNSTVPFRTAKDILKLLSSLPIQKKLLGLWKNISFSTLQEYYMTQFRLAQNFGIKTVWLGAENGINRKWRQDLFHPVHAINTWAYQIILHALRKYETAPTWNEILCPCLEIHFSEECFSWTKGVFLSNWMNYCYWNTSGI